MLQKLLQLLDAPSPQARQQGLELLRILQPPPDDRQALARQLANEDRWESAVWCLFPDPAAGQRALRGFLLRCATDAVASAPLPPPARRALEGALAQAARGELAGARAAARAVGRDGAALTVSRAAAADLSAGAWTITAVSDDIRRAQRVAFCADMGLSWLPGQQDRAAWEEPLLALLEGDDTEHHAQARELIASFHPEAQDAALSGFALACAGWAADTCPDLDARTREALRDALGARRAEWWVEQHRTQRRWEDPSLVLRATLDAAAATARPPAAAALLASGALAGLPGARAQQRSAMLQALALRQFAPFSDSDRSTLWSAGSSRSS